MKHISAAEDLTRSGVFASRLPRARLSVPSLSARASASVTASTITRLVASGTATTNADLVRVTGLSRSVVSATLKVLRDEGLVHVAGIREPVGRGRPAESLSIAGSAGTALVADVGDSSLRLAVADLGQEVLAEHAVPLDIARGPQSVLSAIVEGLEELRGRADLPAGGPTALGIALPGQVNRQGVPVEPPIMPNWDGFPVADFLSRRLSCQVRVEDISRVRALAEARVTSPELLPLLFVVVDRGIGTGLVDATGNLHEGSSGSAGSISHSWIGGDERTRCACGQTGCLEAVASGGAMLRRLGSSRRSGTDRPHPMTMPELAERIRRQDPETLDLLTGAGEILGNLLSTLVTFYNPASLVLDGTLAWASDDLLAQVRSIVYRRGRHLATRNLVINHSTLGYDAGLVGCLVMASELLLQPTRFGS